MMNKYSRHEKILIVTFLKFLMRYNIKDVFYYNTRQRHKIFKLQCLLLGSTPSCIFDTAISWSCSKEGWNFWANISYQWKCLCQNRKFETNVDIWEAESLGFDFLSDAELVLT